ncbi:MAG: hypothetical protein JW829_15115 [Pirellulales bacterium]|nr:hypothetical protein [Pirellulales bacterium]
MRSLVIGFMIWIPLIGRADEAVPEPEIPPGYEEASEAEIPPGYGEAPEAGNVAGDRNAAEPAALDLNGLVLNGDANPNVAELEKQLLPQIKQVLNIELAYIQRVCKPTREQLGKIVDAGNQSLKKVARHMAIAQTGSFQGDLGGFVVAGPTMLDPGKLIQSELAQAIQQHLNPNQAKRYQEETEKRSSFVQRATILNLVAEMDRRLILSAEQRDQLVKLLSLNWQENWAHSLQLFRHNNQYLPMIPDQYVVPILTATQKRIWHSTPKHGHAIWAGNIGMVEPMVVLDGDVFSEPVEVPDFPEEQVEVGEQEQEEE